MNAFCTKFSCAARATVALLISCPAMAVVPESIDYQGYLTDPSGVAINADLTVTFSLYTVEFGGVPLWIVLWWALGILVWKDLAFRIEDRLRRRTETS